MRVKEILRSLLVIVAFLVILYVLLSVGNGTFDFALWTQKARTAFSVSGGMGTILLIVSKWLLEW